MNGLLDNQTSGNEWGTPISSMQHERGQDSPLKWHPVAQRSLLKDFEEQMAQYEREYAAHLDDVRKLYVMPPDTAVAEFLNDHRALPQMLITAVPHLRKLFGDTVFVLRATADEFGWQNLYVDAMWHGDALEAFRLLDVFGDEWWIANSAPARGALTFTYRLV
jgi:hypothetical protein